MRRSSAADGLFLDGNPATGQLGTVVNAAWLNMIQAEIISVLTAAGIAVDAAKSDQLATAVNTLLRGRATINCAGGASIALSAAQAAMPILVLTGALTANINLSFPAMSGTWVVRNQTTGAFSLTCKTAAGTGVVVSQGASNALWGDGTNIYPEQTDFPNLAPKATTLAGYGITDAAPINTVVARHGDIHHSGIDAAVGQAIRSVSYDDYTRLMLSMNAGGSTGPVQIEFDYRGQLRWRNQRDSATWSAWRNLAHESDLNNKQPLDATLTALSGLATAADRMPYATGADSFSVTPLTAFIRTLLDDADAAAARATLGAAASATTLSGYGITDAYMLGVGQTRQNVTAQRVAGTTYYNATGRTIEVTISINTGPNGSVRFDVAGEPSIGESVASSGTNLSATITQLVPAGAAYRLVVNRPISNINYWIELRS